MNSSSVNASPDESSGHGGTGEPRSVSVAILTFKRPSDLQRCLGEVLVAIDRDPAEGFSFSEILVIDNDAAGSARTVVEPTTGAPVAVRYLCEPSPGVANARNRALAECDTDVLLFIDDDEVPTTDWPNGLLAAMAESGAAMVGGPVDTRFTTQPPDWVVEGSFFERDNPAHLATQDWLRSGNLALDMRAVNAARLSFDARLRVSEDVAFTRAAAASGLKLVWSRHGSVAEYVGPDRFTVKWRCRREYMAQRGWADTTMSLSDQDGPALRTALRGGHLLATGFVGVARAVFPPSKARAVQGLATFCGGLGRLRGLRPG